MSMAQGKFTINGRLKVEGGSLDGCRLVVFKDGQKHRTLNADLNRFSLELELNKSYILSFEKDGFVTKRLSFDTKVPSSASQSAFTPFDFVVSLFKQYDGVNTVVFNQPVGMIRYDATAGDFDYDTDYTKSIQSALAAAQAEVDRKQKEEARSEAEAAKLKDQEAKAQAKADAKAAKDAAAQAKAQAKQELAQQAPKPVAPPEPAPKPAPAPVLPQPKPSSPPAAPKVQAPKPAVAAVVPKPSEGADPRRGSAPQYGYEPSRVQPALARTGEEPRPKFEPAVVPVIREQDVIVQPNEVVTIVRVQRGDEVTEYRRVARKYSGTFYFKDGASCSQLTYEQEALAEN
ncbi:MAG TPA: hypothetical protein PKD45_09720 [Flavobacteriales bacterium]|nr:hypothetical protein [Flavobacteriales bacterium]